MFIYKLFSKKTEIDESAYFILHNTEYCSQKYANEINK